MLLIEKKLLDKDKLNMQNMYIFFFQHRNRCTFIFVVISLRNDFLGSMRGATTQPMVTISNVWDYFPSL